eukprot:14363732-Heterocapsa_arctica.AAC.1
MGGRGEGDVVVMTKGGMGGEGDEGHGRPRRRGCCGHDKRRHGRRREQRTWEAAAKGMLWS